MDVLSMAPHLPGYDLADFESLLNSFLSAPIQELPSPLLDLGVEGLGAQKNVHSLNPSPYPETSPSPENGMQLGSKVQQQQSTSSDTSAHSTGSSLLHPGSGHVDFPLTSNILAPFLHADQQPLVSFPSNQRTSGVELYTFDSANDNNDVSNGQNSTKNTAKAEKNRSAQKRFRERQKEKVSTLQEQYDAMTAELERLTAENGRLQQRTSVLDRLVAVSETHILSFEADNGVKNVGALPLPDFPIPKPKVNNLGGTCSKHHPRTQHANELEEMKKLTPEMFISKWKEYLKKVSALLLYTETNNPNETALDQMSHLTCDVAWMCKHVTFLNQDAMNKVISFNLEDSMPSTPEDSHWVGVVKLLKFSDQQMEDLRVVLDIYMGNMQKLAIERQSIIQEAYALGNSANDGYAWSEGSKKDHAVYDKLAKQLRKQHGVYLMFKCFFFGQLLTLTQFAKAAVYSYPYFPDALAIMAAAVHGTTVLPFPAHKALPAN